MSLKPEQINLISLIDKKAKDIFARGGNEISVMLSLLEQMPQIKAIIDFTDKEELNKYCVSYEGFYQYMKILEDMAGALSNGSKKAVR